MTYIYVCSEGHRFESSVHGKTRCHSGPDDCSGSLRRDYRAENVGMAIETLRREREHSIDERMAKTMPSNKDFAGPKDPDGTKGMRAWRETVSPASGNKNPRWPGEVEKRVM